MTAAKSGRPHLTYEAWADGEDKVVRAFTGISHVDNQELEVTFTVDGLVMRFYDEGNQSLELSVSYEAFFFMCLRESGAEHYDDDGVELI